MNREVAAATAAHSEDMLHHPRGLKLLFVVEMWERFSFYGMKAILILYLVAAITGDNPGRGWTKADGSILMGWYGGMAYLLPVVGGIIADKLIGTHSSMLIGGLLIALGHIVLGFTGMGNLSHTDYGMSVFIFGLALIVIGTGHFKPTVSVMVGQLYREHDPRRDAGFAIFYMGINLGAFLGQVICPLLGEKWGWHWGFGAAAVGMLAGLGIYQLGRPYYLQGIGNAPSRSGPAAAAAFFIVAIGLSALFAAAFHFRALSAANDAIFAFITGNPVIGASITLAIVAAIVIATSWFVAIQQPGEKGPTACIFIFMMFNAIFWLAFEQAGTSLNLFAMERTQRVVLGWEIPAGWFQWVNSACILLLSPVFAWIWGWLGRRNMDPTQSIKIALGLIFVGFGYLFMVWGGKLAATGAQVSMFFLIMTYFWHTVGELCLSPTGLAFVTRAAPVRFVSLLMGIWLVSSFIAQLAGGYIAATVESIESGKIKLPWQIGGQADFFMLFVISSVGAGVVILILTPLLKKMLHGRE